MPSTRRILNLLYVLGILAQIVIRAPYERQRRQQSIVVDRVTSHERAALALLSFGILFPLIYMLTPWLRRADYRRAPKTQAWAGGAGVLLLAASLWLFQRSHADLGRNWSPSLQVRQEHTLVTAGVYQQVRHPMYASQALWCLAQPLVLQNWIADWSGLATFVPFLLFRVPREEQLMREQFGDAYNAYVRDSGSVLPRLRSLRQRAGRTGNNTI